MEEEIQLHLDAARDLMRKAVEHTQAELVKIRAGKAMPNMLDSVEVEYYGSKVPVRPGIFGHYPRCPYAGH